jgi:uncharacterized protein (TIGR02453 family)
MLNLEPTLTFLTALGQNNNKPWFEAHRPDYEAARRAFEDLINAIIDEFRLADDLPALTAKDCIARIYRDVRFSKDKSPYKTNLGALVAPGGWKATRQGYYIHLEPGAHSMVAGGLYAPTPDQLNRFRQAIDQHPAGFKKILANPAFVTAFGELQGERLKTAPQGYDRAHPDIALLQLKQITVIHPFSQQQVLAPDFQQTVFDLCRAMRPFLDYLDDLLLS